MDNSNLYNEPDLLSRIADGDQQAFQMLVDRYQPYINFVALRLTGNEAMAEDIIQDAFVKVWLHRKKLPEMTNFGGWVYRVAANITHNALKQINHQKMHHRFLQREEVVSSAIPAHIIEQKELKNILDKGVNLLPLRQKEAFQLIKLDGMSYKEAAKQLGVSLDTVKTNLYLAIRFLRSYCVKMVDKPDALLLIFLFSTFF